MKKAILLLALMSLTGCAAIQEYNERRAQMRQNENEATCRRYGFATPTLDFANCMMQIEQAEKARSAEALQNFSNIMLQIGQPPAGQSRPVVCVPAGPYSRNVVCQ